MRKLEEAVNDVLAEHGRAAAKFARFNSLHEGYGVLLEESDELWDEIKKKTPDLQLVRKEAVQVAAMALRIIAELT